MTRLEELRAKYGKTVLSEWEQREQARLAKCIPLEEAIKPYVEEFQHMSKEQLMSLGGNACCCLGPDDDKPLCPCRLVAKAQEFLLDKWYRENM